MSSSTAADSGPTAVGSGGADLAADNGMLVQYPVSPGSIDAQSAGEIPHIQTLLAYPLAPRVPDPT